MKKLMLATLAGMMLSSVAQAGESDWNNRIHGWDMRKAYHNIWLSTNGEITEMTEILRYVNRAADYMDDFIGVDKTKEVVGWIAHEIRHDRGNEYANDYAFKIADHYADLMTGTDYVPVEDRPVATNFK